MTRRSRWLLGALPLALLLVVNEWLFYFPLTPLSLDRMGQTRLPPAPHRVRLLFVVGVATFGAGMTEAQAHRAVVHDAGGVSVALLGYVAPHIGVGQGSYSMQHVAWARGRGARRGAPSIASGGIWTWRGPALV